LFDIISPLVLMFSNAKINTEDQTTLDNISTEGQTTLENMNTEGEIMSDNVREHQLRY
jgi:hypothetical protein